MTVINLDVLGGSRIIIAGAGIGGLSLPIALSRQYAIHGLPQTKLPKITIFERDDKHSRLGREGYSMSIRVDGDRGGGVQVLDDLELFEDAKNAAVLMHDEEQEGKNGQEKSGMCLWEPQGRNGEEGWKQILKVDGRMFQNKSRRQLGGMRIRRNALQTVLANAVSQLPNVHIEWAKTITGVERDTSSSQDNLLITLSDGTTHTCTIFIAADGSSSKIRSLVRPDLQPQLNFTETIILSATAKFPTIDDIPAPLQRNWGMCLAWNGIGTFLSPVDETSTLWSVSYKSSTQRQRLTQPLSESTIKDLLNEARELGKHTGPILETLIAATDPTSLTVINCLDRPPFTHNIAKHGNVIFIGDANHAVSPFAGNGANMALMDSWDLAKTIVENASAGGDLSVAVNEFEKIMVPRCEAVLKDSHRNIDVGHASGMKGWFYWAMARVLAFWMRLKGV